MTKPAANPRPLGLTVELDTTQANAALDTLFARVLELNKQTDALNSKLTAAKQPSVVSKPALRMVLDEQIRSWRRRMDEAPNDYAVEAAGHYIDAYQYIRELFIGGKLPIDDPEQ